MRGYEWELHVSHTPYHPSFIPHFSSNLYILFKSMRLILFLILLSFFPSISLLLSPFSSTTSSIFANPTLPRRHHPFLHRLLRVIFLHRLLFQPPSVIPQQAKVECPDVMCLPHFTPFMTNTPPLPLHDRPSACVHSLPFPSLPFLSLPWSMLRREFVLI